jgi:hypothetical protein
MFKPPDPATLASLQKRVDEASEDPQIRDNHLYAGLFDRTSGVYGDAASSPEFVRDAHGARLVRTRLSRREWIERYFPIRDKAGKIGPLKLNRAQRRLETWILQMEMAGVPVRIIILKARQMGFSTYVQACMFEKLLREKNFRGLIIADNKDRSKLLLQIAETARTSMVKTRTQAGETVHWDFKMKSKATSSLVWTDPIRGEIHVTSAETPEPGRGGTRTMVHLSETAHWPDAERKQAGVMASLPTLPGTYGFDESTANGDQGKFRDDFWRAWKQRDIDLFERTDPWHAVFFAWWEHDEYHWTRTYGSGRSIPEKLAEQIKNSLDEEERWLLKQTYIRRWRNDDQWRQVPAKQGRKLVFDEEGKFTTKTAPVDKPHKWCRVGVGLVPVSIDQLAWRRQKLSDKEIANDLMLFNQEYPSRPQIAFMSTGRPVFDMDCIDRMLALARDNPPRFVGSMRVEE